MKLRAFFQRLFYQRRLKKCGVSFPLYCKAHGVTPPDRQGAIAQSHAGDLLQIVHVPVDGYPFNTYVYSVPLNRVIGYLDETLSEKLVYLFGKGFCRDALVENITGGAPYEYFGCNIQILESMCFMKDCADLSHLYGAR